MAMVVNHNIPALSTYNVINSTSSALQKSINKLSTGLRINSAADDAAGLAISEKMRAQVRGLDQAVSNSQDGISMIQTAEGALSETHSILQRMRELSVQAANDTLTQQDRGYIQEEVDQLREEITRIGNTTQFNKKKLLNGDAAVLWSSSDSSTKAIVNGGLRQIDQFGQKKSVEGNYNITIEADPGKAQVQKSDIFKIKHPDVVVNKSVNTERGVTDVTVDNMPAGDYTLKSAAAAGAAVTLTGHYNVGGTLSSQDTTMTYATAATDGKLTFKFGASDTTGVDVDIAAGDDDTAQANKVLAAANNIATHASSLGYGFSTTDGKVFTVTKLNGGDAPAVTVEDTTGGTAATAAGGGATDSTVKFSQVITPAAGNVKQNASVLYEVTDVDTIGKTATVKATALLLNDDGSTDTKTTTLTLEEGQATKLDDLFGDTSSTLTLAAGGVNSLSKGSKWVYSYSDTDGAFAVTMNGALDSGWDGYWSTGPMADEDGNQATVTYNLSDTVAGKDLHLRNFYLNEKSGEVTEGDTILSTDDKFKAATVETGKFLAGFTAAYIGKVATDDTQLRDLDKFWDSEGNFMLEDPQTITITQGDGKQASLTLYANDTLGDVAAKLNDAIANGLGQAQYVNDASHFATFVAGGNNSESVPGTFVVRSVVSGSAGELSFSGNEALINAFSLNEIQASKESNYTATIKDAHTGSVVADNVQVTGNKLIGVVNPNIDVEFDAMSGVTASWNADRSSYDYTTLKKTTTLHLADNTTVFQIGANEGEDMGINIGDMRSHALGLDSVNVTNRDSASRSITVIDNAIDKVSMQRSKLGAYQNRLEHTINNLTTASENLTAAESRIRDTDMAKEMMNFSKLQIMLQAGNSMLAQANQLPQNVLSLVR